MQIKKSYRKAKVLIERYQQGDIDFVNPALEVEFIELAKIEKELSALAGVNRTGYMLDSLERLIGQLEKIEDRVFDKGVKL